MAQGIYCGVYVWLAGDDNHWDSYILKFHLAIHNRSIEIICRAQLVGVVDAGAFGGCEVLELQTFAKGVKYAFGAREK